MCAGCLNRKALAEMRALQRATIAKGFLFDDEPDGEKEKLAASGLVSFPVTSVVDEQPR